MTFNPLHLLAWIPRFLLYTAAVTAAGAAIGAIAFPVVGLLVTDRSAGELAAAGARTIGFFFFIWAPGISLVVCVMQAYRRRHPDLY